jgi:hypothetical protein
MIATASVIVQDFSQLDGGGYAIVHAAHCTTLRTGAAEEAYLRGLSWGSDYDYSCSLAEAERQFRAIWSVSVPMRQCECLANHVEPQAEIKAGTRVTYHGSIAEFEGEQFTARPCLLLAESDVDCVGYQLYRTDPTLAMSHVRRQSITPVA